MLECYIGRVSFGNKYSIPFWFGCDRQVANPLPNKIILPTITGFATMFFYMLKKYCLVSEPRFNFPTKNIYFFIIYYLKLFSTTTAYNKLEGNSKQYNGTTPLSRRIRSHISVDAWSSINEFSMLHWSLGPDRRASYTAVLVAHQQSLLEGHHKKTVLWIEK